jgi:hypothetical protein
MARGVINIAEIFMVNPITLQAEHKLFFVLVSSSSLSTTNFFDTPSTSNQDGPSTSSLAGTSTSVLPSLIKPATPFKEPEFEKTRSRTRVVEASKPHVNPVVSAVQYAHRAAQSIPSPSKSPRKELLERGGIPTDLEAALFRPGASGPFSFRECAPNTRPALAGLSGKQRTKKVMPEPLFVRPRPAEAHYVHFKKCLSQVKQHDCEHF